MIILKKIVSLAIKMIVTSIATAVGMSLTEMLKYIFNISGFKDKKNNELAAAEAEKQTRELLKEFFAKYVGEEDDKKREEMSECFIVCFEFMEEFERTNGNVSSSTTIKTFKKLQEIKRIVVDIKKYVRRNVKDFEKNQ